MLSEREENGSQDMEMHGREGWMGEGGMDGDAFRFTSTPPEGQFPLQNGSHIKFEAPRVPVIFVLGESILTIVLLLYLQSFRKRYFKSH